MNKHLAAMMALWLAACGGADVVTEAPVDTAPPDSEQAIEIIRGSFEKMGGIERLRLFGSKVTYMGSASADGRTIPFEVTVGGATRWRFDYKATDTSFVYIDGACRKTVYGIAARCSAAEAAWMEPTRVLVGLTFPSSDAANLGASFRTKGEKQIDGVTCDIVEVRPRNSNLKLRAAYDRSSGLLKRASFSLLDEMSGEKTGWIVDLGDWREVDKVMVPHQRKISSGGKTVWEETADVLFFEADERRFAPPIPTTTDQPLSAQVPERRVIVKTVDGQAVEIPAPLPTLGGGPALDGAAKMIAAADVRRMVIKGKISDAASIMETLKGGDVAGGREASGDPAIILVEDLGSSDEPALIVVYVPLAPEKD